MGMIRSMKSGSSIRSGPRTKFITGLTPISQPLIARSHILILTQIILKLERKEGNLSPNTFKRITLRLMKNTIQRILQKIKSSTLRASTLDLTALMALTSIILMKTLALVTMILLNLTLSMKMKLMSFSHLITNHQNHKTT